MQTSVAVLLSVFAIGVSVSAADAQWLNYPTPDVADYQVYLLQWWRWHQVRLVAMFIAMCLVFVAMMGLEAREAAIAEVR